YSEAKCCWIGRAIIGVKANGKPAVKEVSAQTKGQVLTRMKQAEEEARAGRLGDAAKMTAGQYLQHWLDNVHKPTVAQTSWERDEICVRRHLIPGLGGVRLAQLRAVHVEELFAELKEAGINGKKIADVLGTALNHAARVGLIATNPADHVP